MTQIDFYTNVADKLGTACRIVAKGYGLRHRIVVCCPDADSAQRVDRLLWASPATGFIPHCSPTDVLAAVTPVIVEHRGEEPVHDQILINLRDDRPSFFGRFERLIEIVSVDEADRQRARERFRFYRDRGYAIRTHDLNEAATAQGAAA